MLAASLFPLRSRRGRFISIVLTCALGFALAGAALLADTPPNTTPGGENFGQYLAEHQADLAPFFDRNSADLAKDAFRAGFGLAGRILLIALAAGWFVDVILGRAFSTAFSPAYAKMPRAFIYASGRWVLGLFLTAILGLDLIIGLNLFGPSVATVLIVLLLLIPSFVAQVLWVAYLYRVGLASATAFYVGLLVIHALLITLVAPIFFSSQVDAAITSYVDQSLVPRLHTEADAVRNDAAALNAPHDAVKTEVASLETRVSEAQNEESDLQKAIEDRKNSAAFAFSGLVKLHAAGNLAEARTQFAAFLQRFPNDPTAEAAQEQLSEIDKSLAAQAEAKRQEQAGMLRAAARARADLLARAAAGQVTLSQMRAALLGKTPAEVNALFGAPTETGSNRWGYGQRMIFNPIDQTRLGLTVVFSDGVVQGVDYYYGSAP